METRNIRSEIIHQDLSVYPFRPSDVKIGDIPLNRFYLYAREVLIRQQEAENHLHVQKFGDRRYTYLRCREIILSHKYPSRDKTDFEQINSVNTKQKKQSRDKIENKEIEDDYLFYDLGEQGDVNVLDAQPVKSLGLIKKKKHTDTKNMLIKSDSGNLNASEESNFEEKLSSSSDPHLSLEKINLNQIGPPVKFRLAPSEQKMNVLKKEKESLSHAEKEFQKAFEVVKDQLPISPRGRIEIEKSSNNPFAIASEKSNNPFAYSPDTQRDENSFSFRGRSGYNSEVSEREGSSRESSREGNSGREPRETFSKKEKKEKKERDKSQIHFSFCESKLKFSHNKRAVTRIKFGGMQQNILAYVSIDKTLTIIDLTDEAKPNPKPVILKGHTGPISDFDWSMMNDFIVTCSIDNTIRIWDVRTSKLIRTITHVSPLLSCLFHPINNNVIFTSTGGGYISLYNFSTGKEIMSLYVGETRSAKTMTFSDNGKILYVGCINGDIIWYECTNPGMFTQFQFKGEMLSAQKRAINSICYREYHSAGDVAIPSLLVNPTDSTVTLYRVAGTSLVRCMICPIVNKSFTIKSSFSPLLRPKEQKASFVSGSEDGIIYFYSYVPALTESNGFNNILALKGHNAPVLDVVWNYDESLLASADAQGNVFIWKREDTDED